MPVPNVLEGGMRVIRGSISIAATVLFGLFVALFVIGLPNVGPPLEEVPFANPDIQERLARAIDKERFPTYQQGFPPPFNKPSDELAHAIISKMMHDPAQYNRPQKLWLGDSTQVQLVIKTNEQQDTKPYFKDFEGQVINAMVLVARDVSAELTGPPDRLQITLRGDKMRTSWSPEPIMWIWDVKPLKPGPAHVTLEVTSYIKTGDDKEPVPIRVLQDTWIVNATGLEWAKYVVGEIEPIRAFVFAMAAGVVAVLAWFGIRGLRRGHGSLDT
jgi:hypothetical protein